MLKRIIESPTTIDRVHESGFKSTCILEFAKYLLVHDTSAQVVLELIRELEKFEGGSDPFDKEDN